LNAAEHPYRTSDLDEAVGLAQPSARRTSFRRLLVLLVLGVALPLTGLAAASVWHAARNERARFETQLVANARSLALAVDRELGQAAAIVRTLAASARLPAGELPEFHAHAARIAPPGATILLFDAAGRRIVSRPSPSAVPRWTACPAPTSRTSDAPSTPRASRSRTSSSAPAAARRC
jgi:hypothetical protein